MKIGHTIDEYGFWTGDVLADGESPPDVFEICPAGFYRPKWDGDNWVEGLTLEEIDELMNTPQPETADQKIARLESEVTQLREESAEQNLNNIDLWEALIAGGVV